jgi:superfamily II DNA or RNA helicase
LVNVNLTNLTLLCGAAAVTRGRIYYEAGRVGKITRDPEASIVKAIVKGSGKHSYETYLYLNEAGELEDGDCRCPVGINCKHVAALALAAAGAERTFAIKSQIQQNTWQQQLKKVLKEADKNTAHHPNNPVELGLQFRVDGLTKKDFAESAHKIQGVSIRPVRFNQATGAWIGGGYELSWDSLRRGNWHNYESATREWLAELSAMRPQGYWGSSEWTDVGEIPGRLFWPHLARGIELGVELVTTTKKDQVLVDRDFQVQLDLTRANDSVQLQSKLIADGAHVETHWGLLGRHGAYTVSPPVGDQAGWTIVLASLSEPVPAGASAMIGVDTTFPAADLGDFYRDYLPELRQHLSVVSSDKTVEIPAQPLPTLVATAVFVNNTTAQLEIHWEYTIADTESSYFSLGDNSPAPIRDRNVEATIWQNVSNAFVNTGLARLPANGELAFAGFDAMRLVDEVLPVLAQVPGVEVQIIGEHIFTELTEQPVIELSANDTESADWFDLAVSVRVADREVPLPNLFEALAKGRAKLMLVDGSWLRLNHPSLDTLRNLLADASRVSDKRGKLRVSKNQAGLWDELADIADVVTQSANWRKSVTGLLQLLRRADSPNPDDANDYLSPPPVPLEVKAELRPYQVSGFEWLAFCWANGLGGILADDMGLGKTLQTLALVQHARNQRPDDPPFLVVAPSSVVSNWAKEAARFTPKLKVVVLPKGIKSESVHSEQLHGADIVVTSYAILRINEAQFRSQLFSGMILDEAQFIKNRASKTNQAARKLSIPFKLAITGTPLENNIDELWAILAVVAPGLFPSFERFREDFSRPVEALGKHDADLEMRAHANKRLEVLRNRVRPLLLRRTKDQVAPELPPRIEQVLEVELAPAHRRAYDVHLARERSRVLGLLEDFEANRVAVFRALTTLRRMALDATLIDNDEYASVPSSKVDVLMENLQPVLAEGHSVLVFSQFTSYLAIVARRLTEAGIKFSYLDGTTRNRGEVIDSFRRGASQLFLISLKAGGFGLNLTEADYVFLLDPWWNPAVEAQAVDRTHRIGQTKSVMVFRLVSKGTIEEKVMALKSRKAALVGAVLRDDLRDADAAVTTGLSATDIRSLLQ